MFVDFGFAERYDVQSPEAFHSNLSYGTPEVRPFLAPASFLWLTFVYLHFFAHSTDYMRTPSYAMPLLTLLPHLTLLTHVHYHLTYLRHSQLGFPIPHSISPPNAPAGSRTTRASQTSGRLA